jgi:hypothetical protein
VHSKPDGVHIVIRRDLVRSWVPQHREHLFVLRALFQRPVLIDPR